MNKYLAIALTVCICIICVCAQKIKNLKNNTLRLENNVTALLTDVEFYKTENGKSVARAEKIDLTYKELERNYDHIVRVAEELDLKVKKLEAAATTTLETKVIVKDSIIYRDREIIPTGEFLYSDAWAKVEGKIKAKDLDLKIQINDTIRQIIHRVPRKFLFFRWGTKAIVQEVVSSNPYTNITYTEYLEIVK